MSADALKNGTADKPMTVYVAPYVYWIDDPAATDTVQKTEGYSVPYGMVVNSEYLTIKGLTGNPDNVVLETEDSHMPLTVTTQCSDSTAAVHLQLRT